ncbi:GNAT family N-acetyltransferase [Actibacterium lipolyticum]|uniref:Anhydro-N-acetylmuramic acid kinase n=1 Tax=Actibacterium lipolyticum TaxID=1524263 RepID=A0A238KU83_9RHOB|nr:GNAT family N-acetyltransferase [Actibacterium lipolyticum]SMX45596.1 anhydro-N-acetylmuramic acid kinase [Actibacterium lipolyticum]
MTTAPTITTTRLQLRHHRIDDFEPMAAMFATDWSRYMGGPVSRSDMWRWLASEVGSWSLLGFGSWAVDLRENGECIGQVGVNKPANFPEVELGWMVYPAHEGKGFAFEAADAVRDWAFGPRGLNTLVSYIDPENERSIALAERLGATRDDAADLPEGETPAETLVYRHPAPGALH